MGFDAHNHLDFPAFDADRDQVVARARAAGITGWVIAGSDHTDWDRTERVADHTGGYAVLGVHPWETPHLSPAQLLPFLADLTTRKRLVGIGEIGLDALHAKTDVQRTNQRHALRAQLALARERDLPVAFHAVRAWPELLDIVAKDGLPRAGGMMHAWSGPADLVDRCVALGLHVSFASLVLHDRAVKCRASVPRVPDHRLLLETDSPGMKPRGATRGEPADLVLVAAEVARLRAPGRAHEEPVADLLALTERNARALFALLP